MMRSEALFLNGVFESVLQEILQIQSVLPEHIMFLQPHSSSTMRRLRDDIPTIDSPMRLLISITTDLPTVRYVAEIVSWDDKREVSGQKREVLNRIIKALQPGEEKLYNVAKGGSGESVNLLHIRRLRMLDVPRSVSELRKISDGTPLSTGRTTAGGWSYVTAEGW